VLALSSILVFLTTFLAAGLAVLIGWFAFQRMGAEAAAQDISEHLLDDSPSLLKNESLSTISPWARLLERSDFVRIMHRHLLQSGLTWSVGRITLLMLLAGSLALGVAMHFDWIPGWADLAIAAAVAALAQAARLLEFSPRLTKLYASFNVRSLSEPLKEQ
jgi:Flp pilus assembly protein TadB